MSLLFFFAFRPCMVEQFVCADVSRIINYYIDRSSWYTKMLQCVIEIHAICYAFPCEKYGLCKQREHCEFIEIQDPKRESEWTSPICYNWRHLKNGSNFTSKSGFSHYSTPFRLPQHY